MAVQAQALRLDATHAHFFRDFVRLGIARQFAEGLEMMRALPCLDLLLVTFGTGIRTDDLCGVECDCAVRGSAEDHQHGAERKHRRPKRFLGPETNRPKAMRSENDSDAPPLQPTQSAVPAGRGGERAGSSASWFARQATPSRGRERFPRPGRWSAGTDPHSKPHRFATRSI